MSFEQYVRDNPMPTKVNDKKNYHSYGPYHYNKYENPFEKLHQKALNCSDRDKLPPEIERTIRQESQVSLQAYKIEMSIPKIRLKETLFSRQDFDDLLEKIINNATTQLVKDMKKEYPEYPDEILTAFVKQFIDLEITNDCNFRTQERFLKVTPTWKDVDMIDFESEEQKLLDDYFR